MSRKANPTAIGGFVVGATVLLAAGVVAFGGGSFFREKERFVLFFDGSLQGLQVGAPVLFRGVKIGQVSGVVVQYRSTERAFQIPVYIELEPSRIETDGRRMKTTGERRQLMGLMVSRGLRAQLVMQSFVTGMLAVQLDFFPNTEASYKGENLGHFELPTIPSPIEEITKTLQDLPIEETVADFRRTLQGVDDLVRSDGVRSAVLNFDRAASELADLARGINERLPGVSDSVVATLEEARRTLSLAGERIASAETTLTETLREFQGLARNINGRADPLLADFTETSRTARVALQQARETLRTVQLVIEPESRLHYQAVQALEELRLAAAALRHLADLLERRPEVLIQGK